MNTYYSNLIEGHNTHPRDIERALAAARDEDKRDLHIEAAAHYHVQEAIDNAAEAGQLPDPADHAFIRQLHRDFYAHASEAMLKKQGTHQRFLMTTGAWRH